MRLTVIFLVFANISYFAWGAWQESQIGHWLPDEYEAHDGERLIMLSEIESSASSQLSGEVAGVYASFKSANQFSDVAQECLVVGPFANLVEVDELQQRLFAVGINSQERADENSQEQDYWVHIPPLSSRSEAIRLLRKLQAQRIDSFVITQGELANGISLGLYSRRESAKAVSRRLSDAGYGVAIKHLSRVPEQWWLEMDAAVEGKLDTSFFGGADLRKLKKSCKNVASGKEFL